MNGRRQDKKEAQFTGARGAIRQVEVTNGYLSQRVCILGLWRAHKEEVWRQNSEHKHPPSTLVETPPPSIHVHYYIPVQVMGLRHNDKANGPTHDKRQHLN